MVKYTPEPVYWVGNVGKCDGCNRDLRKMKAISDIKTYTGQWGLFCDDCVPGHSIGKTQHYGMGLGQRYEIQADNRWLKVTG